MRRDTISQALVGSQTRARTLVTFDLFSALIDSRSGATEYFDRLIERRHWKTSADALYDEWDRRNKASQRDTAEWVTFAEHGRRAMRATYAHLALDADPDVDATNLFESLPKWPLWPDVADGLGTVGRLFHVGILSNVDTALFRITRVARLVDDSDVLTSERLGTYKPAPAIYRKALEHAGDRRFVHVASSARDVRGATEADIPVVRLVRPGHVVDLAGLPPIAEARSLADVTDELCKLI